ncbi:MAG TPA: sulfotransferase [Rhizomicrobium sp.]|nr:sulfotransferase [Rhizomicrobium sp.]
MARHAQAAHAALRAGDIRRAAEFAEQAVSAGAQDPQLLTLAAYRNLDAGKDEPALHLAERACQLAPGNLDALNAAASALLKIGQPEQAASYFERALAITSDDVDLLVNAAGVFEELRRTQRACELLERAFHLDSRRADAAARLAFISTNHGDMEKGRAFGLSALKLDATQAFAAFAVALADIEQGHCKEAIARMRALMSVPRIGRIVCALAENIIGDALDGLGSYDEAFAAYTRAGEMLRSLYAPRAGTEVETALARSRRIAAYVSHAPSASWISDKGKSPVRSHVFLLGFPRSGTTLLTRMLDAHPDITALDEPRTLSHCSDFLASDAGLDKLAALSDEERLSCSEVYWRRAAEAGWTGDANVLIDKIPLHSEVVCLIAKLFPDAKIVLALRDPRDVVFSCFRRRFAITSQTYELLTLRGAAAYYDATMQLFGIYRSKIALPVHEVRLEDMATDFAAHMRELCRFLDIDPNASFAGYAERVRNSDMVTPNAAQISKGIRSESLEHWRRYRAQLEPVMPLLAPWTDRFGYSLI